MLILLELFPFFWTHEVHYKLQQSTLQNFDDGGLLSGWSFVRWSFVRTPLVSYMITELKINLCRICKSAW